MKDKWQVLSLKLNELSVRERGIVFATVLIVLYMLFQLLAFDPLIAERKRLAKLEADIKAQTLKINADIAQIIAESKFDPNKKTREQIEQQRARSSEYQQQIKSITDKLIEPEQMSDVLASLLNKESGLKLTSVKTQSAVPIKIGSEAGADLYQHTIKLKLTGKYDQVQRYLSRVEALPEKVFWQNLVYQMKDYPVGQLSLEVYTLSTSEDLIGVYQ
ncbi:type 4a pilus biogenesis protein PilO [Litoribacillus peritrichatus]|uniref:MSHA fimbrial biogenesis protein MshJ n=1 Tax=Litoribacillus peritrichatus TaxID=718191 RepID=A0ABP7MSK4_9GAMM